jgi:hypothetical protein
MNSDGNTAARRKKFNRRRQDINIRSREAARVAVDIDATPPWVDWVLDHRASLGLRFTPLQWTVLNDTYWDPYDGDTRQQKRQALKRHTDKNTVREALHAAEDTAFELYYYWRPAHERWLAREAAKARGEKPPPLSAEDRALLAKHRRGKKGRLQPEPKHLDLKERPEIYGPNWQGTVRRGHRGPMEDPVWFTDEPLDQEDPGYQRTTDDSLWGEPDDDGVVETE